MDMEHYTIASFRKMLKEMGADEFIKLAEKMQTIAGEARQQQADAEAERQKKLDEIEEAYALSTSGGLTADKEKFIALFMEESAEPPRKTKRTRKPGKKDPGTETATTL